MVFGREFSEKLTHLMVATAICCATASATVIPAPTAIGLVEALLGGAALAHFVLHRRYAKADALVRRCARQMESGAMPGWRLSFATTLAPASSAMVPSRRSGRS
jgi:hypothetical protein